MPARVKAWIRPLSSTELIDLSCGSDGKKLGLHCRCVLLSGLPALSMQHGERAMTIFSLLYFIYFYVRASVLRISVVAVRRVVK